MKYCFTTFAKSILCLLFMVYSVICNAQYIPVYDENGRLIGTSKPKTVQIKIENSNNSTNNPSSPTPKPTIKPKPRTEEEEANFLKRVEAFKKYSYIESKPDANGLKLVKTPVDGRYGPYFGYCDSNYVEVIEAGYYEYKPPSEGLYALKVGTVFGWGFKDKYGKTMVPFKYGNVISTFKNGRARVVQEDGRAIWIDKNGNKIIDENEPSIEETKASELKIRLASYQSVAPYPDENGLRLVSITRHSLGYGYLDSTNTEVITSVNTDFKEPSEGYYALKEFINNYWGFKDKNGQTMIAFRYGQVLSTFQDGMARVILGKLGADTMWIDKSGNKISDEDYKIKAAKVMNERLARYSSIAPLEDENGLRLIKDGDRYGYLNRANNELIKAIYIDYKSPTQGCYALKSGLTNKWGFVYKNNNKILDFLYDDVLQNFENGVAQVVINGRIIWIDYQGKERKVKTQ